MTTCRSGVEARAAPSAVALGPVPPVPEVPPAPADLDGVVERLRPSGVDVAGLVQLGWAGPRPVCAWDVEAGRAAVDRWRALCGVHRTTGLWPVLLGPRDELSETSSVSGGDHEPEVFLHGMEAQPQEVLARLLENRAGRHRLAGAGSGVVLGAPPTSTSRRPTTSPSCGPGSTASARSWSR